MSQTLKAVLTLVLLFFPALAMAKDSVVVKLNKGEAGVAYLPTNTSPQTEVVFYFISKGNVTTNLGIEAQGPKGVFATVEASQLKGTAVDTLEKGRFWKVALSSASSRSARVPQTRAGQVSSLICSSLPDAVVEKLREQLSAAAGRELSYADICIEGDNYKPGTYTANGSSNSSGEVDLPPETLNDQPQQAVDIDYGAAQGFLQKDNCSKIKSYLVSIRVNLEKVDPAVLQQGFEVRARIQEAEHTGGRAASLKPVSDGMYAPRPLLLMQSLGGSQWVNMVSWSGNKPKIIKKAAVAAMAYYRGLMLVRIVADSLLSGGRGEKVNFELTNGSNVYNVCGKRARVRWRVNGYPGD